MRKKKKLTRETLRGADYVDLIAEWGTSATGAARTPKKQRKSQPKRCRARGSRAAKGEQLRRAPIALFAA